MSVARRLLPASWALWQLRHFHTKPVLTVAADVLLKEKRRVARQKEFAVESALRLVRAFEQALRLGTRADMNNNVNVIGELHALWVSFFELRDAAVNVGLDFSEQFDALNELSVYVAAENFRPCEFEDGVGQPEMFGQVLVRVFGQVRHNRACRAQEQF